MPARAAQRRPVPTMTLDDIKQEQIFGWPTFKSGRAWRAASSAAGAAIAG
jgi:hypothetical protein